jgi:hypothetical protein
MTTVVKGFRTPASVHVLAPVTGRRPKTLNGTGHLAEVDRPPRSWAPAERLNSTAQRLAVR